LLCNSRAIDVDDAATDDVGAVPESDDSDTDGEGGAVSHGSADAGVASTHDGTDGGSAATATADVGVATRFDREPDGGGAATEGAALESTAADRRRAVGDIYWACAK